MNTTQVQTEVKGNADISTNGTTKNPKYILMAGDGEGNVWKSGFDDAQDEATWLADGESKWMRVILYRIPIHKLAENWQSVSYYRYLLRDRDEDLSEYEIESYSGYINTPEPECEHPAGHDWTATYDIEGGLESNPGVFVCGPGLAIKVHCTRCNHTRLTRTGCISPIDGSRGHTMVHYGTRRGDF